MVILAVEISLNLLLNIIIQHHFDPHKCIAYYNNQECTKDYYISPLAKSIPIILNDYECNHGCTQYVIDDPLCHRFDFDPFDKCMVQKRNSNMRAIIILKEDTLHEFIPYQGDYGLDVIIILPLEYNGYSYFIVGGYLDLEQKYLIDLNAWNISTNQFVSTKPEHAIERFFYPRWKDNPNTELQLKIANGFSLSMITPSGGYASVDFTMMTYFAEFLNVRLRASLDNVDFLSEMKGSAFGLKEVSPAQVRYAQSYPSTDLHFVICTSKPTLKQDWLQLIQVFKLELWLLIISTAICTIGYFWLEETLIKGPTLAKNVFGLFLLQGLSRDQVPQSGRSRFILVMAFVSIIIYSALFGSCVVSQLISPQYIDEFKTEADIERMGFIMVDLTNLTTKTNYPSYSFEGLIESFRLLAYLNRVHKHFALHPNTTLIQIRVTRTGLTPQIRTMTVLNKRPFNKGIKSGNIYILATDARYASLLPLVNDFILKTKETGLYLKWEWLGYSLMFKSKEIMNYMDNKVPNLPPTKLTIKMIQGPFWYLLIGLAFASFTFLFEKFYVLIVCYNSLIIIGI